MPPRPRTFIILLILTAAVGLTYFPILGNDFVNWDDQATLYENRDFNPPNLAKLASYWRAPHADLYIPVTYTFWWTVAEISWRPAGLPPAAFHAASILLHLISTVAIFGILLLLFDSPWPACAGAVLFAVHPVQVESLAWASGAKDLLAGALSLLAIWLYLLRGTRPSPVRAATFIALATLAFILAMFAKPSAVVAPLVALALDWLRSRRWQPDSLIIVAGWLTLAIPVIFLARYVQHAGEAMPPPIWQRPLVAADALTFYASKLIIPLKLAVDYGRTPAVALSLPMRWIALLIVLLSLALVIGLFRRRPWVAVAFAVFLAALLPYLGFAPFDFQKYSTVADHYLYVAMLGPAILIAGILREHRRPAAWSIAAVVLLLLMIRAHLLSYCWRNSTVLFTHTLRVNPRSLAAHNTLGFLLAQQGDLPNAEQHYRAALAVRGWDPAAHFNLANLLAARGDLDQSIAEYRAAVAADPGNATIHNNLGVACARANQLPEAVVSFLNALNLKPDYADAHANLGVALAAQGRTDEARNHLARALQIDPNNAVAQRGLQRTSATAPVKAGG